MTGEESRRQIEPLVLPTQLDSEESESESEDENELDTKHFCDENTSEYDEDVDEYETKLKAEEIKIGIEKAAYLVSCPPLTCSDYFSLGKLTELTIFADVIQIKEGEQQSGSEDRERDSGGNSLRQIYL